MDGEAIEGLIERLDSIMRDTPADIGVGMGSELFDECRRRGLLTMETFSIAGRGAFPEKHHAYRKKHFASLRSDYPDWEFRLPEPRNGLEHRKLAP